ncbi:MAG: hypothetical protein OER88_03990 [Planctomycetota bacterium]|nr:hypothetical protein [Planctomycetota bacterium]
MWDLLLNWEELSRLGTDLVAYAALALIGTLFFVVRLLFALFGFDADADVDGDLDGSASDASFSLFSLLSILAFLMGAGWMGLAARLEWGLARPTSFLLAVGFGSFMMTTASGLMLFLRKMTHEGRYDLGTAVGKTGRAYVNIPAKGEGQGQIEIVVSGRKKILSAVSDGDKIASFSAVRVLEVRDDDTLVVQALD